MKPPNCTAMQELTSVLLRMGEIEGALSAMKAQMHSVPYRMAKELSSEAERREAACYLYWHTDIPKSVLAKALLPIKSKGGRETWCSGWTGTFTSDERCYQCHEHIVCNTRQQLQDLQYKRKRGQNIIWIAGVSRQLICDVCLEKERQERDKKYRGFDQRTFGK